MRLAFCIHTFAPVIGGSESLVGELARRLARRGHPTAVVTSNASSTQAFVDPALPRLPPGSRLEEGVAVTRLPYRSGSKPARRLANAIMPAFQRRRWPGYAAVKMAWVGPHLIGLRRSLERFGPDRIVAAAYPFAHMVRTARWARRRGVPYVAIPCLHPHDPWAFDNPRMEAELRTADAVVALTPYERDYLVALGCQPTKVQVLGLGFDPPLAAPASTPEQLKLRLGLDPELALVLFLGRKEESKGVAALVAAARSLWRQGGKLALVLAGPETAWSRAQRGALGRDLDPRRFRYLEEVDAELKQELLAHCDIVALPSHAESFGIVFLEAWAAGKPVIGGRTGATGSLVTEGEDGLLVAPGDAADLARALGDLLSDPVRAARMGAAGRAKSLRRFVWDRLVDQFEELLSDLPSPSTSAQRASSATRTVEEQQPNSPLPSAEGQGEGGPSQRHSSGESAASCPDVSVLIVSHNAGEDLQSAVSSAAEAGAGEIIVIDNASSDGSPAELRRRCPQVRMIELPFNAGFADGNNRGLRLARGQIVVLLNQDARLEPGALGAIADGFASHPGAGILAPRILVREEPRVIQSAGLIANQILYACDRGYLELDGPTWRKSGPVIGGSGAALAIRRRLLDQIGLFDPALFMYYEDLDLCLRARLAGWEVLYLPEAIAYHRHRSEARGDWHNEFLDHRNRLRLILKTFAARSLPRRLSKEALFQARSAGRLLFAGRWQAVQWRLLALLASILRLPSALKERREVQARRVKGDQAIEQLLESGWGYPREVPPTAAIGPMRPATGALDFSPAGSDAFSLGWYPPERDAGGWFRWSGGYGLVFLGPAERAARIGLRVQCLVDQKLELWWDAFRLGTVPIRAGEWQRRELPIPAAARGQRLLLVSERAFRPADLGVAADRRLLGTAFSELALIAE